MADDAPTGSGPGNRHELVQLLEDQHAELHSTVARVPRLHGAAREDVFLQTRRMLAVHEALERRLLADSGHGSDLAEDMRAVEAADPESAEFASGFSRVVTRHLRHGRGHEEDLLRLVGALEDDDGARVATAVRLWQGEGDAYLGNTYAEMLRSAEEQLAEPVALPE